jgi:acetyl esterase/lipase
MRQWLRGLVLVVLLGAGWAAAGTWARSSQNAAPARVQDVIYGRKFGTALTMDVFKPARPNGIGALWMVSGGWVSSHDNVSEGFARPFTDRGQTVFAIVHGSQPKFTVPEILQDIHRATRFVRYHAREYGVDPDRLGICGGSAGGHLSLMQGTRGAAGDPNARDPVDRASSRVQAVACFFPPTDFLNWGKEGQEALTFAMLKPFYVAFGSIPEDEAKRQQLQKELSPIYFVSKAMPPTLIIHGDADALVPIQQSQRIMEKLEEAGVPHQLVVRPGKGHGWPTMGEDLPLLADWFEKYLPAGK